MRADQALAAAANGEARYAIDEAEELLRETLADGPVPAKQIEEAARAHDISKRTLARAKRPSASYPKRPASKAAGQCAFRQTGPEPAQPGRPGELLDAVLATQPKGQKRPRRIGGAGSGAN